METILSPGLSDHHPPTDSSETSSSRKRQLDDKSPASTDAVRSTTAKRSQVPRACDRCKSLRRGCSEYRPCKRCVDAGLASQCRLSADGHPSSSNGSTSSEAKLQRLANLIPSWVVEHCARGFFERLYPTIPILTHAYVERLQSWTQYMGTQAEVEALCVLGAMCAQVLLQAEDPDRPFSDGRHLTHSAFVESNDRFGCLVLDAVLEVHRDLPRRPNPSLERCLLSFFLYACQARLAHHSLAFLHLRETTSLMLLSNLRDYDDPSKRQWDKLFWVLVISERSHAIRYGRPASLQVTADSPTVDTTEQALVGFECLVALFRPIDTFFIALLNQEIISITPTPDSLSYIESAVNSAVKPSTELYDTQKANLRVTQLWLRIIIWQLRLKLGYLKEESRQSSMTYHYPLEIARELMLSTRDLPIASIRLHGVGLTEKLYDLASAVVDVLARVPISPSNPRGPAHVDSSPENDLYYLRHLIARLPSGSLDYNSLLDKHIDQALPSLRMHLPPMVHRP